MKEKEVRDFFLFNKEDDDDEDIEDSKRFVI